MNSEEAKRILMACRPGIDDREDPQIVEALRLAEQDSELKQWLERQRASQKDISVRLRSLDVPADLREEILARRKVISAPRRSLQFAAVAAVVGLLCALSAIWFWPGPDEEKIFAAFRSRMVRFAVREYRMDIVTNDAAQVRQYLAARGAPADYVLSPGLEARPVIGGAKLSWQGHPVAMICLSAPGKETLYLFVVDRDAVRDGEKPGTTPTIVPLHRLQAASWTRDDKIYLLASPIDLATLPNLF